MRGAKVFALAKRSRIPQQGKVVRPKGRAKYMWPKKPSHNTGKIVKEGLCSPSWEYHE
jgi:hypothetical protein